MSKYIIQINEDDNHYFSVGQTYYVSGSKYLKVTNNVNEAKKYSSKTSAIKAINLYSTQCDNIVPEAVQVIEL